MTRDRPAILGFPTDRRRVALAALTALALATNAGGTGCSSGKEAGTDAGNDVATADALVGGACNVVVQQHASEGAQHTPNLCDPVSYGSSPPSSGTHYPTWAAYKTYDKPVPWGFLVHNLEHGAVVISYRCPAAGCTVDTAPIDDMVAGLDPDRACVPRRRIIIVPEPDLDVAFAASAWTWTLRADCFDAAAFSSFVNAHNGQGPETICDSGPDLSSTGWCP